MEGWCGWYYIEGRAVRRIDWQIFMFSNKIFYLENLNASSYFAHNLSFRHFQNVGQILEKIHKLTNTLKTHTHARNKINKPTNKQTKRYCLYVVIFKLKILKRINKQRNKHFSLSMSGLNIFQRILSSTSVICMKIVLLFNWINGWWLVRWMNVCWDRRRS